MQSKKPAQSLPTVKKVPSRLIEDQLTGKSLADIHRKPEIIQFLNIGEFSIYPHTDVPLDEPLFIPDPPVIQFSNYEPLDTKTAELTLRNKDKVSRRVKILAPDTRLFSVARSKSKKAADTGTKVAPGMLAEFIVQFTPEAKIDYAYDLVVVTEREKFVVPIRCQGQRAMVSFPDLIDFGICPVKHQSEKPVIIRNVGEKATKWVVSVPAPFSMDKSEGFLEVGQVDQLTFFFKPIESRVFQEEVRITYDNLEAFAPIIGEAHNDSNVYLNKIFINFPDTYITLSTQESLKIINKSQIPIDFEWRAFANEREEFEQKARLHEQLQQEEAEERLLIEEQIAMDEDVESLDSDDSYDELEIKNLKERKLKRALAALERKYKNIKKAVDDDLMLFQGDVYQVFPQKGKIWPNSEIQVTVTFKPMAALQYSCTVYCNVTCSEERLPLNLTALGIGPKAELNYEEYDIGDVFVNSKHVYDKQIFIENKGEIECKYRILPYDTPFGSKFQFANREGVLGTTEENKRKVIAVTFQSDILGEFSETFRIELEGSSEVLVLTFKGHVMAPSFEFNTDVINFGEVSYDFQNTQVALMRNTSEVPMTFNIRVPGDGKESNKEFNIIPSKGTLQPKESINIQIDFMSKTVKKYDMVMVVDIEGVGQDMHTLPIRAECFVPKVEILPADVLDFNQVFLRHDYSRTIELKNLSKLRAKFEILEQDEQSTAVAKVRLDKEEGYIEGRTSTEVKIYLIAQKTGSIRLPLYIRLVGSEQPHMLTLIAVCSGPIVDVITPELDFGKVDVLRDYTEIVTLHNRSDIPAEYTAFTKNKMSVFKVHEKTGTLQPGEIRDIKVFCNADECINFLETLHFAIKEGKDVEIVLKARGSGNTAFCQQDLEVVDFGTVFTCRNLVQRCVIENRGRKVQKLTWNRINSRGVTMPLQAYSSKASAPAPPKPQSANTSNVPATTTPAATADKDKDKNPPEEEPEQYVFTVNPEFETLPPKTGIAFEFIANAAIAGPHMEKLVCTSTVGNERKAKSIFNTTLQGNFINPFLQFSDILLDFAYVWQKGVSVEPLVKELEIRCVSELPTNFILKCGPPFSISKERFSIESGQAESIRVEFDPGHKIDKVSGTATQKLMVIHQDHPQRDSIDLRGTVNFPNLKLDTTSLNFGCILDNTRKKVYMKMTNDSVLDVKYEWVFVEEHTIGDQSTVDQPIPVNEIFDILPMMGVLRPKEEETVEFVFNSLKGKKYQALASCIVEGGPEYEVSLVGESSLIKYQLNNYSLNYGKIPFNESTPLDFTIENTGKVPFQFSINLDTIQRPGIVDISPGSGKIAQGENRKITVKLTPGVPDVVNEQFLVEIAHFDPIVFKLTAIGIYPAVLLNLGRPDEDDHTERMEKAKSTHSPYRTLEDPPQSISTTSKDSKNKAKNEPYYMDLEAEADRLNVCQVLGSAVDEFYSQTLRSKATGGMEEGKSLVAVLEDISVKTVAAAWVCNFGNMVLSTAKSEKMKLTNTGQLPVTFSLDAKWLKLQGLTLEPSKVNRLPPGGSQVIKINFQSSKKTMNFGPMKIVTNLVVKGGLCYHLAFLANLTTPDFSMSSESIDFGKVLIGTLCKAQIRLENLREVKCEWSYVAKHLAQGLGKTNKDWERFQLLPSSGVLLPNQKCVMELLFTPLQESSINQKLEFKIEKSQLKKLLTVKGMGMSQKLEFIPSQITLGPVLPYRKDAWLLVEMRNPTEYPCEVYSVDHDSQYREEEEMLRTYEGFAALDEDTISRNPSVQTLQTAAAEGAGKPSAKALYYSPRVPGDPVWKEISHAYEKKQKKVQRDRKEAEMRAKLSSDNPDEKSAAELFFQSKETEDEEKTIEVVYPSYIPETDRYNVVVWGRPGLGKTFVAEKLAEGHKRLMLRMDEVVEWNIREQNGVGKEAERLLAEGQIARETVIADREKQLKKNRKKELEPLDEAQFIKLPIELLTDAWKNRLKLLDCNAGCVIDDLFSKHCQDPLAVLTVLSAAFKDQNLQLLLLDEKVIEVPAVEPEKEKKEVFDEAVPADPVPGEEADQDLFQPKAVEVPVVEKYLEQKAHAIEFMMAQMALSDAYTEHEAEKRQRLEEERKKAQVAEEEEGEMEEAKGQAAEVVEALPVQEVADPPRPSSPELLPIGKRLVNEIGTSLSKRVLLQAATEIVPAPVFPDPDSLPLPPPQIFQIVTRPKVRQKKTLVTNFSIWTPIDQTPLPAEPVTEEQPADPKALVRLNMSESNMDKTRTRWIIPAFSSNYLVVSFYSMELGNFETTLQFEIVGCSRHFNLPVTAVCEFPVINSDVRNMFMKRKKTRPTTIPDCFVSKHYIMSESKYDFGPLLIGKSPATKEEDQVKKTNGEKFQITNNGKYKAHVEFALKSSATDAPSVFVLDPTSMDVPVDETQFLTVWAFPSATGVFTDEVICLIQDNPNPVIIPVSCIGEKPIVEVDSDAFVFERILLKQKTTKTVTLKSQCKIPVKWNLTLASTFPEEFSIPTTEGTLKPHEESHFDITFTAIKQQKFHESVSLDVQDLEGYGVYQEKKTITLDAEAFSIAVDPDFGPDGVVDFSYVKVFEEMQQTVKLKNMGLYEVKYTFLLRNAVARSLIKLDPAEGTLSPNQEQPIQVFFRSEKEVVIPNPKEKTFADIRLQILEGKTGETFKDIPVRVKATAVFSKYSLNPVQNINFGPVPYGESKARGFEIRNDGIFEFEFNIKELLDERLRSAQKAENEEEAKGTARPAPKDAKKPVDPKKAAADAKKAGAKGPGKGKEVIQSVEIGQYSVAPSTGSIPPNSSVNIEITFTAEGDKLYQKTLALDVTNRDPTDSPGGIPYDLSGESCIPGIFTTNFDSIFEEQRVIPSLEIAQNQQILSSCVYAEEENVFLFGTLMASKAPEGKVEKFKVTNCAKIFATVNFAVKPRTSSKSEGFAFEVSPSSATIPPHGRVYVSVAFKPTNMMAYGGVFEATVAGGEKNPKTGVLRFELRGEGTLPTITLTNAAIRDNGRSSMEFKKTRVGKSSLLSFELRNGGSIAATARFDLPFHESYQLLDSASVTLAPKATRRVDVQFAPKAAQVYKHEVKMATVQNQFETLMIDLVGEGFKDEVVFEGLPRDFEDQCHFGDCFIGVEKPVSFVLRSYCEKTIKFMWPSHPQVTFQPSTGHLRPLATKTITAVFKGTEEVKLEASEIAVNCLQITQQTEAFEEWDNSMTDVKYVTPKQFAKIQARKEEEERKRREAEEAAQKKAKAKPGAKKDDKKQPLVQMQAQAPEDEIDPDDTDEPSIEIAAVRREPNYMPVEGSESQKLLYCYAVCDLTKYQCAAREIQFAKTMMLATRSFKFALKNAATISMPYKFKICNSETGKLDAGPYSIAPKEGNLAAGCDEVVIVKYSPVEVDSGHHRLLVCSLLHLHSTMEPLVIELSGKATRPIVHFELPPSTYREKKAQDMIPIDPSYQILEFESLGTKIKNIKRFYVVNPTNQGYEFSWEPIEKEGSEVALKQFTCSTLSGTILSGKKFEMAFEYAPEAMGIHETYWNFKIPSEGISQIFLVVGTVVEPTVVLDVGKILFGPLLLGGKSKETVQIVNQEHIPFPFTFVKSTISGEQEYGDSLSVLPISGVVPPQGSVPIEVSFHPKKEIEYNYNLVCNVKRKLRPLVLNVKGQGYIISHSVHYESQPAALLKDEPCLVQFGDIFVNETQSRSVQIVNSGKFNFDFTWKTLAGLNYLAIAPESGTVRSGDKVQVNLTYAPKNDHKMKKLKLMFSIVSGPMYTFLCTASARKPAVKFSFTEFDFGPCVVLRTLMSKTHYLEMTNFDDAAISIESEFEKKPHLDVQLAPGQVLIPTTPTDPDLESKKLRVPIVFTPRDTVAYSETVTFDINGVHTMSVLIKGEGCPLRLELASRDEENVNFGVCREGGDITKTVHLTNKSKKSVTFVLEDGSGMDELKRNCVSFSPTDEVVVKPKEALPIELRFNPTTRLHPFLIDLLMRFSNGEKRKLLSVQGACHGIELKLMEEVVKFGSVVKGSHSSQQVQLVNLGDLPAVFEWDRSKYEQLFTITPTRGTVPPNEDLYFEITFHPLDVIENVRIDDIECRIEGGDPLTLSLMGKCISTPPEQTKELPFNTEVRKPSKQKINIRNPSQKPWRLSPSISTLETAKNYWTGALIFDVPANGAIDYEITYLPMTMTAAGTRHEGALFFPLPDGTALVYNLVGTAAPPSPIDRIVKEIKAKQTSVQILQVPNWLKTTQRFKVTWEVEGVLDPTLLIQGANTIDVPGSTTKDYKLTFITYKLGVTKFTVTFKNPVNDEYLFYTLELKATSQDTMGEVELACPVRETVQRVIMLGNPLSKQVDIPREQVFINNDYVQVSPALLSLPPKSESGFELSYRPLTAIIQPAKLTVKSPDLGEFTYDLMLKGQPSTSQRSMHYKTSLGTELVQAFRFQHFLKKQIQYIVKIERIGGAGTADFTVDKPTCDAAATPGFDGIEVVCNVRYEPSNLGEARAILTLTHPEGGEYSCLLYGQASAPVPQGPFKILPGKGAGIDFKNPFAEAMEFSVRFDNPCFTMSNKSPIRIEAKKGVAINVAYKAAEGFQPTGRMMIASGDLPSWIYYLSAD